MYNVGDKVKIIVKGKDEPREKVREIKKKKYDLGDTTIYVYNEDEIELVEPKKIKKDKLEVERVLHQDIATIVFFSDGSKEVVRCQDEKYDREKAIAVAISKRVLGGYTELKNIMDNAEVISGSGSVEEYEEQMDKIRDWPYADTGARLLTLMLRSGLHD